MNYFQQLPNIIQRYATLTAMREHYSAGGKILNKEMLQEISAIEARALSALSPQELQQAQANANHIKQSIMGDMAAKEQARQIVGNAHMIDNGFRNTTKDWLGQKDGLTKQQFNLLAEGQPVPIKGKGMRYDPKQVDDHMRNLTRHLTKNGKGMGYEQAEKLAQELIEKRDHRGHDEYVRHMKSRFGGRAEEYARFVHEFETSQFTTGKYMADKAMEADRVDTDRVIKPSDADVRKAQIARAWAGTNETDEQTASMFQDIDPSYTDPKNRTTQGDIARIVAEFDDDEYATEQETFNPETYNESELAASWHEQEMENEKL